MVCLISSIWLDKIMARLTLDQYLLEVAQVISKRSTCLHRKQGVVIARDNRVLSTGFNGQPPGQPHCEDIGWCAKDEGLPCRAQGLHGESNAIATAAKEGISILGATLYTVYSPCLDCCNLISVAGIKNVKYGEVYDGFPEGLEYLNSLGIPTEQILQPEDVKPKEPALVKEKWRYPNEQGL